MNFPINDPSLLNYLLDTISDGILILDGKGKVFYGNLAIFQMLDIDRDKISNKGFLSLIENVKVKNFFKLDDRKREKELGLNGYHLLLKHIPYRESGKLKMHIFTAKDITEVKDSQSQLIDEKMSLDMIEDLLEYAYEGFALVDSEGRIVKWNYEKLFGIKEEDAIGRKVSDVIENTRLDVVVRTGKKEIRDIQRIQGHDMVANRVPIIRDGKIIGAVGAVLFRDASDIREMTKELIQLENKVNEYKGEIERLQDSRYTFDSIITKDPKMEYLKKIARTAAQSNSTVLILGESGTGKELFAQAIHKASYRKFGPFIPINCAAIPRDLLESELFGYEAGAFTGARRGGKPGKFELANGGTIFLDEIGDMPLDMQVKLLRVIEEKEFERIGGTEKIFLDARILAATNEKIEIAVKEGKFREDLYYRLNVINVDIPPLRERMGDISLIAQYLLDYLVKELNTEEKILHSDTLKVLMEYSWPGNVRELRNVLERAINLSYQKIILPSHLPERLAKDSKNIKIREVLPLRHTVGEAERRAIMNAITASKGNKTMAAKKLGIHRTALYDKIKKHHIEL